MMTCTFAFAQKAERSTPGKPGLYPSFIQFSPQSAPAFKNGRVVVGEKDLTLSISDARVVSSASDAIGWEHHRYQQVHAGIPVENAVYMQHVQGGKVISANGDWVRDFASNLPTAPAIGESVALSSAKQHIGARAYKWDDANEEQFIKRETGNRAATFRPTGELVYYSGEGTVDPQNMRLAYKFDIYAQEPLSRQLVFVDALDGRVLGKRELLHTTNAAGTAVTGYSGTQAITTDNTGTTYRLQETGRGLGIQTFNLKQGTNYGTAVDFTDADNNWNNVNTALDQYATDAHWGAEQTYDYYLNKFGRNSIDGKGYAIKSYVHYSKNYFNAFWDGTRMTYGDGSSTDNFKPLTAIDVCGHEITHGLTTFTANLNYSNESGAMNEGFSDIFGTAIEVFARPTQNDWLIGGDFYTIRSMSAPKAYTQPDTYQGTNWYTGTADNGGVHTNSGVLNYWFYLLSVGKSGTNDKGTAYNVTGIGIDKAAAIAYRTLTTKLTAASQYADCRSLSILAAQEIYGVGSTEATQTANAWDAVGVVPPPPPIVCTDTYEANETRTTAKAIPVNTTINANIGTSTDVDFFSFVTTTAQPKFKVVLSNLPANYDLRLYSSTGTTLASSANTGTANESITRNTATSGATYYVRVIGSAGAFNSNCYALTVTTSATNLFDANGTSTSASEDEGLVSTIGMKGLGVYPNPGNGAFHLVFDGDGAEQKAVTVIDLAGRVLHTENVAVNKGKNNISLNLPMLQAGTYLVKLGTDRVTKLVITR